MQVLNLKDPEIETVMIDNKTYPTNSSKVTPFLFEIRPLNLLYSSSLRNDLCYHFMKFIRSNSSTASIHYSSRSNPTGNYMLKVNNRNTRTRCEICSKLTNMFNFFYYSSVSVVNFEHVNAGCG